MTIQEVLQQSHFGHRVAEEETRELQRYFVTTDQWMRMYAGDVDIVYGPKGSGKSALYYLLLQKQDELLGKGIVVVSAEQPRGTPVFKDLQQDPPTTEREFNALWKLYLLSLLGSTLKEFSANDKHAEMVYEYLANAQLLESTKNLPRILKTAFDYAKRVFRPNAIEAGIKIDPYTGLPAGFTGKISFQEPASSPDQLVRSVDDLLTHADASFEALGTSAWILLDRLDVAFAESPDLEANALRALFRTYLDLRNHARIHVKIFLRTDIWTRITREGFREASHITRTTTISWDRPSLLSLIVRRVLNNEAICKHYRVSPDEIVSSNDHQTEFFYRVFPGQVDVGPNKPTSLDWMIGRTKDGSGKTAPRELVHLLNACRDNQLRHFEMGDRNTDGEFLFSRLAIRESLPMVSEARLNQTLFAEYPQLQTYIERLAGQKTEQYPNTLAALWLVSTDEATRIAETLIEVGFFERRGTKIAPVYWVPFLYRDAAKMIQGSAD